MPLLAFVVAIFILWWLAVHLIRIFPSNNPQVVNVIDAVLTVIALIWVAWEAHKGGLF